MTECLVIPSCPLRMVESASVWKHNDVTIKDSYPLPSTDGSIEALPGVWCQVVFYP